MTMPADTDPTDPESPTASDDGGPIEASRDAAELVERMSDELGLWQTRTEAALFLASLAAARDADPVEASRLDDPTEVGHTDDVAGTREALTVLGLLDDRSSQPSAVRREQLPGWIEAGAEILEPRLAGADVAEATEEISGLLEDLSQTSE